MYGPKFRERENGGVERRGEERDLTVRGKMEDGERKRHPSVFLRTWYDREEIGEAHLARHILAESTSHRRGLQSKMNRDTRRVVGD